VYQALRNCSQVTRRPGNPPATTAITPLQVGGSTRHVSRSRSSRGPRVTSDWESRSWARRRWKGRCGRRRQSWRGCKPVRRCGRQGPPSQAADRLL